MLQPGDRLMFIDHISLRGKSINEVNQLFRNTDEIVKLKIKKDDIYTGIGLLDLYFFCLGHILF
jgi:hypothetical protein